MLREHGFTLLEIMAVLAIMAALLAVAGQRLFNNKDSYRSFVYRTGIYARELRNLSRLKNLTTRLVIRMGNTKENAEEGQLVSAESASGYVLTLNEEQSKAIADLPEEKRKAFMAKRSFQPEKSSNKKPMDLPRGLFIESVEYANQEKTFNAGTAYVHFFPQGLSEEAIIVFTDRATLYWSVLIPALTGRVQVFERKVSFKDLPK